MNEKTKNIIKAIGIFLIISVLVFSVYYKENQKLEKCEKNYEELSYAKWYCESTDLPNCIHNQDMYKDAFEYCQDVLAGCRSELE